jgi:protein-S-isoprenylcysteine O-methyltransferase Ste14
MRHPLYSGMLLWTGGLVLLTANWIFAIFAALMCGAFIDRVPKEEQMMIDEFGEEYREYMKRTRRFLPKF